MKKLFLKSLINLSMIEIVLLTVAANLGSMIPTSDGVLIATAFMFILFNLFGLIPAIATSCLFAYLTREE